MPLTTIDFDISDNEEITQTVYSKRDWIDSWTNRSPSLFCRHVVWNVSPEMPTATLHYRYGQVDLGAGSFTTYKRHPPVTRGDYIKIDFVGHEIISGDSSSKNKSWYGQVISIDDNDAGVVTINCHGMESILLEKDVDSSVWLEDRDALSTNWVENRIDRVIPFNVKNRKTAHQRKLMVVMGFRGTGFLILF